MCVSQPLSPKRTRVTRQIHVGKAVASQQAWVRAVIMMNVNWTVPAYGRPGRRHTVTEATLPLRFASGVIAMFAVEYASIVRARSPTLSRDRRARLA